MKGRVIKALPGTGKTKLASMRAGFVDTDAIILERTGEKPSKAFMERIENEVDIKAAVKTGVMDALVTGATVLSNFETDKYLGIPVSVDVRFKDGAAYISHLKQTDRSDLLEKFEEEELKSWNDGEDVDAKSRLTLVPGQYLSTLL